ncbi:MAG TPA: TMEM165/GDT1 family protein [Allosphingosinicella sp.]
MEPLLTSFIAAALAEWGGKTQLLAVALAVRYRSAGPVLAGIAIAALLNALIAAAAGLLVHGYIALRAISLLIALALVFAGVAGLMSSKEVKMGETWKTGPFLTSLGCFFLLEFGDKTQFLTFAISAQFNSLALAAAGATAGVVAASVPAVVMAEQLPNAVPMKAVRIGAALLFLLVGLIVAVNALRLV